MAKKKYDRGMNNFKIEQLEPRQMFSADVGLNDIEQQLENIPDIVENTLESIDNLQMSNLGLDATLNSASAILPDIATDIQSLISSTFANYKNSLPPNTESISLDTLAAELNNRITTDLPQSFVNPLFSVQNEDTLKLNLGYQSNADVGNLNIDAVALQTNNVTISASVLANVSVEIDFDNDDVRIAKAKDLIDDNQAISLLSLKSSEVANLKQIMGSASQIAKSSYRQSLLNTTPFNGINDPNTSAEEKQSLINSLDSAVTQHKFSAAEMAVYLNALASSSGYVFGVDTESDSLVVSIVKHEMATNPNIAANVTGFANVATNLQGVNVDGGHNVDRNASFSVKLDGASNPEYINQTVSVAAHFRQYTQQDVDDESDSERKAELEDFLQANGSVLEYKSIADVEFYISTRTTWAAVAT